jgi:hypothetical protein
LIKKSNKGAFSKEEEINIVQKIAQRDALAFAAFYDHHSKTVFSFLSQLLKNRGESEDTLRKPFGRYGDRRQVMNRRQERQPSGF